MNKSLTILLSLTVILVLNSCSGIKYLTVETREPAQITLPHNVLRVTVVNNVVQQPNNVGHNLVEIGKSDSKRVEASADSVAVYYTEALAQFLNEEDYFQKAIHLANSFHLNFEKFSQEASSEIIEGGPKVDEHHKLKDYF